MNKHEGSTLESFFEELGELEEIKARAAKKILAIQAERRMKELGLSTTVLASQMRTSRNQVHRILDQEDAGITLKMLFRLARVLRMPLVITFGGPAVEVKEQKPSTPRPAKAPPRRRTSSTRQRAAGAGRRVDMAV